MGQKLFSKPKDVRYVDMAIWIDENFYQPNCDMNKAYTYMWLLAYMLACKKRYFTTADDYEEYASLLAYSTYQRMLDTSKSQVKSVLNYMKSIASFRRLTYEAQRHQEVIDPSIDSNWDSVNYVENCKASIESSNRERLVDGVIQTLKESPSIIKSNIPKVYRKDRQTFENIYTSCLLSMINRLTLPNVYEDKFDDKLNVPTFDEVKYYKKHLDNKIIIWHLPFEFEQVILLVINKTLNYLADEIKELSNDVKITDNDFINISASGFNVSGDNNYEANN